MKAPSSLLILVIVLVVVIAALFLVKIMPERKVDRPAQVEIIVHDRIDRDFIVRIELSSAAADIVLERTADGWHLLSQPSVPLSKSAISNILLDFSVIYVDSVVEKQPDNLKKYGLTPPVITAKALLETGDIRTYYIGNRSAAGTYYLMTENDNTVYTVLAKYGNHFSYTEDDLRDRTLLDFPLAELDYIRLSKNGNPAIELVRDTASDSGTVDAETWMMREPYTFLRKTDPEELVKFLKKIVLDKLVDFVDDDPALGDLALYGLYPPQAELELRAGEELVVLFIGNPVGFGEDGIVSEYYVQLSGSSSVVTVEARKLRFLDIEPFELIKKTALNIDVRTIESVSALIEEINYDVKVGEKDFLEYVVLLSGLSLVSETEIEPVDEFELFAVISIRQKSTPDNNSDPIILEFFYYNSRHFLLTIGDNTFLVPQEQVEQIIDSLNTLTGE